MQKYTVNQYLIENILSWVKTEEIAIPEIQRPFVWSNTQVRDLMDSLYQGYPVGYIITWRNPNIRLKDGSISEGKKILIDGQQRIIALTAAILGHSVINKKYKTIHIKIAFDPIGEKFEVQNSAILNNKVWLPDISKVINGDLFEVSEKYLEVNPNFDKKKVRDNLTKLINIPKKQIGMIELDSDLGIETVTEIFIRINSKGVELSQADFVMSKISADKENKGNILRKVIDYFCHLAIAPEYYQHIVDNDQEFMSSEYINKISWLKNENDDLYDPDYRDLIRVAFTSKFNRGRLTDLVSLLSGRNFETKTFEREIAQKSFARLFQSVEGFINQNNFQKFLLILRSAGFVSPKLLRSKNVINFAYILYLKLREIQINSVDITTYVSKWMVYTLLTGRYSNSPESSFDFDIKQISSRPIEEILKEREESELSDAYWNAALLLHLDNASASSPYFHVFLAAQVKAKDYGFLSKDVAVRDLVELRGDIHHLFPKDYLKKQGYGKNDYNQIANYAYMQSEINIRVGNLAPNSYFEKIRKEMGESESGLTGIKTEEDLLSNLESNCIPLEIQNMKHSDYLDFLELRRKLMAKKIRAYYFSL